MRSLPEVRAEFVVTDGNCQGRPFRNWLHCLLGGLRQSGTLRSGFSSPQCDIRGGQLVLSVICTTRLELLLQ